MARLVLFLAVLEQAVRETRVAPLATLESRVLVVVVVARVSLGRTPPLASAAMGAMGRSRLLRERPCITPVVVVVVRGLAMVSRLGLAAWAAVAMLGLQATPPVRTVRTV